MTRIFLTGPFLTLDDVIGILSEVEDDEHDEEVPDWDNPEYDEYWCISISPFTCGSCGFKVCYAQTGPHLILIWENNDDDEILELAALFQKDKTTNYDPRIERYNRILGPCIEWDKAKELGWLN